MIRRKLGQIEIISKSVRLPNKESFQSIFYHEFWQFNFNAYLQHNCDIYQLKDDLTRAISSLSKTMSPSVRTHESHAVTS